MTSQQETSTQQHREEEDLPQSQVDQQHAAEDAHQDINNRQASPSRLAFITATELPKFIGNRTLSDDVFAKVPEIGEICDKFRPYLARHNITNNYDKITTLKINVHAIQGDGKHTLSSILDGNINSEMITFEQVETLLKRVYKN